MADTKISALPSGAPALATDELPIARSSNNYKLTVAQISGIGAVMGSGTAGSVLFVGTGPVFAQDNTNFAYTTTSGPRLQVGSGGTTSMGLIAGTHSSGASAVWMSSVTPSSSNYSILLVSSGTTALNAAVNVESRVANTTVLTVAASSITAAQPIRGVTGAAVNTPAISFSGIGTDSGLNFSGDGGTEIVNQGVYQATFKNNAGLRMLGTAPIGWASGSPVSSASDILLTRYAAKQLMISGDGTGATTNAGWILGYQGTSGWSTIRSTVNPSFDVLAVDAPNNDTILGAANSVKIAGNGTVKFTQGATAGAGPSITAGTATTDVNALSVTQTWNNAGTSFTAVKVDVTSTASNTPSRVMDLRVDGASVFSVRKDAYSVLAGASPALVAGSTALNYHTGAISAITHEFVGASIDSINAYLTSDAANTLAQRNSTSAQTLRVYNTYTDTSNYIRTAITNGIQLENAGTGAATEMSVYNRSNQRIIFGTNNTHRWTIDSSGHFTAGTDNTYDIGASGATRPRNLYLAGGTDIAGNATLGGFIAGTEIAAPAAPAANGYRLFAQDNGAGKTQLMVIFGSGAAQQIAIEP